MHFYWFERKDYQSIDGVEATIFKPTDEKQREFAGGEWAVHTRTRASASPFDKAKQNEVIRSIRKLYGGNFYNDWFGRNRYTKIEPDPRLPAGRGIYAAYEQVCDTLDKVSLALPDPTLRQLETSDKTVHRLSEIVSQQDPSRIIYNLVLPFAVAAIEYFFSTAFIVLLTYDQKAKAKIKDQNRKLDMTEAVALNSGEIQLEQIIASWYTFQNLASVQKAYYDWFGIDMWKLIRQKKRVGKRIIFLDERISQLIQSRHGVIHRFGFDLTLTKEETKDLLDLVKVLMDTLIEHLELDRGIKIREE